MRTTLTLDDDLHRKLKDLTRRKRISFKQAVNETIRDGLRGTSKPASSAGKFRVRPVHCGFVTGVDIGKINQLVDELEAADFVSESRK